MMTLKSKSRVMIFVTAFFVATVMLVSIASAESLLDRAKRDGINIGILFYVPFSYQDSDGKIIGADVDMLEYLLKKMGITEFKYFPMEFGALIPSVKTNRIDVISTNMWVRPKRCQQIQFSEPNIALKHAFVVKKGNPRGADSFESIKEKGIKLGFLSGSLYPKYVKLVGIPESNVSHLPDMPTSIAALKTGRIEALVTGLFGGRKVASEAEDLELTDPIVKIAGESIVEHGAYGFRKSDADFVKEFNKYLLNLLGTNEHLKMVERYGIYEEDLPIMTTSEICGN